MSERLTDFEIEITARFTAIERVVQMLLADNLARRDVAESETLKASFQGSSFNLAAGLLDADDLMAVADRTNHHLRTLLQNAAELEAEARKEAAQRQSSG